MKVKRVLTFVGLTALLFFALHVTIKAQQTTQTIRTIFNNVWDRANHQLMTTPGVGAQGVIESDTTILNDVWDSVNNMLRVSGGAGAGTGDFSSNTATSVDNEVVLFSGSGGKTGKRATGTGFAFLTDGVLSVTASAGNFGMKGINQQTGTSYTVLSSDESKMLLLSNTAPVAVTLPNATTPGFTEGAYFLMRNISTGLVTVTPTGTTINGAGSLIIRPQEAAFIVSNGLTYAAFRGVFNPMTGIGDLVYGGADGGMTRLAAGTGFLRANGANAPTIIPLSHGIVFSVGDPGGTAIVAGATVTSYTTVPFACTIAAWNLLVDAGTVTVKFWKVGTGIAIPTGSNSINTNGVSISTGTAVHSTTLTDFTTTAVSKDDILAMNVTASATAKYVSATLQCDQ